MNLQVFIRKFNNWTGLLLIYPCLLVRITYMKKFNNRGNPARDFTNLNAMIMTVTDEA